MRTSVKLWMSGDPISIEPDASALEALDLMTSRAIRHLPVTDSERRVVGVLSAEDLRAALPFPFRPSRPISAEDREVAREWQVGEIMTHAPETLHPDAPLAEAAERMAERRIGCLPIVDEEGRLAGILSETDALYALVTSLRLEEDRESREDAPELEQLVAGLRSERERIAAHLDHYHSVERELSVEPLEEPRDLAERGSEATEVATTARLDALASRRLAALDRALEHAARGTLGICERCKGAIPLARLRALPGTTLCLGCASEAE